jgi:predicted unusual protein kinase regulating ubiquinone biosynthesis (AarF/ABC1/UbiB family)
MTTPYDATSKPDTTADERPAVDKPTWEGTTPALAFEMLRRVSQAGAVPAAALLRASTSLIAGSFAGDTAERRTENQAKNAEMLFNVLGSMRGGAAKLGQALSVFEPAIPQHLIEPYRQALTKLQEQLPPLPFESLRSSLAGLPDGVHIDPSPVASASLGQVHRGTWLDGRTVAVKIQYPGIAKMVRADALALRALGPVIEAVLPGSKAMNIVDEHVRHLQRELDYDAEARSQRRFARAWSRAKDIHVPEVVWNSPTVLVTEWSDDIPLREVIAASPDSPLSALRDKAGQLLLKFTLSNPERLGLVHGDPHPGNFRIAADGSRLTVLDFGAVGEEDGFTELFALAALAMQSKDRGELEQVRERWVRKGWLDESVDTDGFVALLDTDSSPLEKANFRFTRDWMNTQASRWWNPSTSFDAATVVRMPAAALLEHRALTGVFALCCQLEAKVPLRTMLQRVTTGD